MLSYVVVNSGDYLRYTLSDQDIGGLLGGKFEWSPGELLGWELNEPVNSWVRVPLRVVYEKVVKREMGIYIISSMCLAPQNRSHDIDLSQ